MGELTGQPDLRGLGRGIGLDPGEADTEPRAARDIDDPAGACRLHVGRHRLREMEGAFDIDIKDHLPLLRGHVLDRLSDLPAHAACIVDEDVDPSRRLFGSIDKAPDSRTIGDIDQRRLDAAPSCRARLRCGFVQPLCKDIARPGACAACRKRMSDGAAEAMRSAGHDHGLAGKFDVHGSQRVASASVSRLARSMGRLPSSIS